MEQISEVMAKAHQLKRPSINTECGKSLRNRSGPWERVQLVGTGSVNRATNKRGWNKEHSHTHRKRHRCSLSDLPG